VVSGQLSGSKEIPAFAGTKGLDSWVIIAVLLCHRGGKKVMGFACAQPILQFDYQIGWNYAGRDEIAVAGGIGF